MITLEWWQLLCLLVSEAIAIVTALFVSGWLARSMVEQTLDRINERPVVPPEPFPQGKTGWVPPDPQPVRVADPDPSIDDINEAIGAGVPERGPVTREPMVPVSESVMGKVPSQLQLAEEMAEGWNNMAPVDTKVRYWTGENRHGPGGVGRTRSQAFVWDALGVPTPVVYLNGVSGPIALSQLRVEPRPKDWIMTDVRPDSVLDEGLRRAEDTSEEPLLDETVHGELMADDVSPGKDQEQLPLPPGGGSDETQALPTADDTTVLDKAVQTAGTKGDTDA